ncbi:MAG: discoidin domain-containing protein, partial [Armatimonadetes bacterium]|nr:discoidin domain-containing protein [Armatimonadota bacterium]
MRKLGLALAAVLWGAALFAAPTPIRSDKDWAIYPQQTAADWQELIGGKNLAAGLPVTLQPDPNYRLTTDPDDAKQLTDGALAAPAKGFHSLKTAVAWAYHDRVRWQIDLGQAQAVGQVVFRAQVFDAKNTLPKTIAVSLSDDGVSFVPVRNLSLKVDPDDNPALTYEALPADAGIVAVRLNLGYTARHVRLDFATDQMMLCSDELAVLEAAGQVAPLPALPAGQREYEDNVFDRRDQFKRLTAPGNLLLGLPLKYAPQPGYRLTTGESDPSDLTNGQLGERTNERIWFEQGAVTWQGAPTVTIFADLGAAQPVDCVVARFLGGGEQGGLVFPDEIRVLASDDGEDYFLVSARHKRGLDDLSAEAWDLPEVKVAWVHNFVLPVKVKARYVAVQVTAQKQFISSDEIAAVKGAGDLPEFRPDPQKKVEIITSGVAFVPPVGRLPVCHNLPLRAKFMDLDARAGKDYAGPCKFILDIPDTLKFVTEGYTPAQVEHGGRKFTRYTID